MHSQQKKVVAALDLGGTWIKGALIDAQGKILARAKKACGADQDLSKIKTNVLALLAQLKTEYTQSPPQAIGLASAGFIDRRQGLVVSSPNLPRLNGTQLQHELAEATQLNVHIDNDANCAALGESWLGSGLKHKNFILFTLGTGVGGGIIIDRQLWRGEAGRAGEIGHIVVDPAGYPCNCGGHGCLETLSSQSGIKNMLADQKGSPWYREHIAGKAEKDYPEFIAGLAKKGDAQAAEIVQRFGWALGVAVADLLNILDLHCFIFGGGVAKMFEQFHTHVLDEVKQRVHGFDTNQLKLLPAALGSDAGFLGAARLALEQSDG